MTIPWRGQEYVDRKDDIEAAAADNDGTKVASAVWEFDNEEDAISFAQAIDLDDDAVEQSGKSTNRVATKRSRESGTRYWVELSEPASAELIAALETDYGGEGPADRQAARGDLHLDVDIDVSEDDDPGEPEKILEWLREGLSQFPEVESVEIGEWGTDKSTNRVATKSAPDFDSLAEEHNGIVGSIGDADYQFDSEDDARDFADAAEELGAKVKFVAAPIGRYGVDIIDSGKSTSRVARKSLPDLSALFDQAVDACEDPEARELVQDARRQADEGLWDDAYATVESAESAGHQQDLDLSDLLNALEDAADQEAIESASAGPVATKASRAEQEFWDCVGTVIGILEGQADDNEKAMRLADRLEQARTDESPDAAIYPLQSLNRIMELPEDLYGAVGDALDALPSGKSTDQVVTKRAGDSAEAVSLLREIGQTDLADALEEAVDSGGADEVVSVYHDILNAMVADDQGETVTENIDQWERINSILDKWLEAHGKSYKTVGNDSTDWVDAVLDSLEAFPVFRDFLLDLETGAISDTDEALAQLNSLQDLNEEEEAARDDAVNALSRAASV